MLLTLLLVLMLRGGGAGTSERPLLTVVVVKFIRDMLFRGGVAGTSESCVESLLLMLLVVDFARVMLTLDLGGVERLEPLDSEGMLPSSESMLKRDMDIGCMSSRCSFNSSRVCRAS